MLNPDYKEMLSILLDEQVEFVLVGAYALAAHGFPRATGDIDIFVRPSKENSRKILRCLERFGAPTSDLDEKTFAQPGNVLQVGVAPQRIDLMNEIDGVSFAEASADALTVDIEGLQILLLSKANLVKNKRATGRKRDILDAEMLSNSEGAT